MATRKDVVLLNQELGDIEIYPLAHKDHYGQIIYDTYARKEIDTFAVSPDKWVSEGDYYIAILTPEDNEKIQYVKATDSPVWDVRVDPIEETSLTYKTQIKNRAYVTTLITEDKSIKLISMKPLENDILVILKGMDLNEHEEA